jgi:FAD:protein FMN transferase
MTPRAKNILYTAVLLAAMYAVWWYRKADSPPPFFQLQGQTMATTYHVSYFDKLGRNFQTSIDSILVVVNKSINNYDTASEICLFNRSSAGIGYDLPYLKQPLEIAQQVFTASNGAFDPTVMPLINAWGFGPDKTAMLDSVKITSLLDRIGFEKVKLTGDSVIKLDPRIQLDFGGIGQGYGADVIASFLKDKGITNMLVELGGEGAALGKNLTTGKPWQIGILDPNSTHENQFFKAYASLSDKAFTTSGNYFNYKIVNGKKYGHTINPKTGFPVNSPLLSVTVFADNCTLADAWGTAFMVMGHTQAMEVAQKHAELDVLLLYTGEDGSLQSYATDRIKPFLTINP